MLLCLAIAGRDHDDDGQPDKPYLRQMADQQRHQHHRSHRLHDELCLLRAVELAVPAPFNQELSGKHPFQKYAKAQSFHDLFFLEICVAVDLMGQTVLFVHEFRKHLAHVRGHHSAVPAALHTFIHSFRLISQTQNLMWVCTLYPYIRIW